MKTRANSCPAEREMILALLAHKPPFPYARIASYTRRSITTIAGIARANGFCAAGRARG